MSCECESWAEHLFEPEEALTEAERVGLARHLALCDCCAAEREMFLESWSALDDIEDELEPCPMIRAKVWEKIREEGCGCVSRPMLAGLVTSQDHSWRGRLLKLSAAAAAILLGFGLGRSLRPNSADTGPSPTMASAAAQTEAFLDPALIELASQDGYSMEIFPEATQFTPIDREMMTELAPAQDSRKWMAANRGEVIPLRYISQGLPQPARRPPLGPRKTP